MKDTEHVSKRKAPGTPSCVSRLHLTLKGRGYSRGNNFLQLTSHCYRYCYRFYRGQV